jgi:hypothetical protein
VRPYLLCCLTYYIIISEGATVIDIFAKWIDGKIVCVPRKKRGMSKGEYLRTLHACEELNNAEKEKGRGCASSPHDQKMISRGRTSTSTR